MHDFTTGGRRGISAATLALLLGTAACGTATTAIDPGGVAQAPPAAVKLAPVGVSADAAERRGNQPKPDPGSTIRLRRVPNAVP